MVDNLYDKLPWSALQLFFNRILRQEAKNVVNFNLDDYFGKNRKEFVLTKEDINKQQEIYFCWKQ
jgi:hypothetical protein